MNIGFSCKLLTNKTIRIMLVGTDSNTVQEDLGHGKACIRTEPDGHFALVVSGDALLKALQPQLKEDFLKVCAHCQVVLACRVSPQQKADLVTVIRTAQPTACTLSIGDGANDVNMLMAAHVGVGIAGVEGQQAVRASDYAIAQFSFLKRLLFVHGRESYRKNATLICYNFYKNVLLVMPLFFYGIFSAFSGQSLYNVWTYQSFNLLFAALPIMLYAVADREVPYELLEHNALFYRLGLKGKLFNTWVFWGWILEATFQALFVCVTSVYMICGQVGDRGSVGDMAMASCMAFGMVVVLVNVKIVFFSYIHFWFSAAALVLSTVLYFAVSYCITDLLPISGFLNNFDGRGATSMVLRNPNFYVGAVFLVAVAFMFQPVVFKALSICRMLRGRKVIQVQELEISDVEEDKQREDFLEQLPEEHVLRDGRESIKRFTLPSNFYIDTGFAYSGAPGHTPQVTDPAFNL